MGFIIFLFAIVLVVAGFIFINTQINNLKYRAEQQLFKNTGFSSSEIDAKITGGVEKKHLEKFLQEHSDFTEESIKDLLRQYTMQLFNRNLINEFSQAVSDKMQKDSKLDKMQSIEFRRININYYSNSKLNAIAIYSDNRDEYNVYLNCSILGDKIQLDKYQIVKGAVLGF